MKKLMICAMLSALAFTVAAAGFDRFRTIYPFPVSYTHLTLPTIA